MQVDRQTKVQKVRCTNILTDKRKQRLTDIHRQTDRQTDSSKVLVQAEKQTDLKKDQYSHIRYIPTVLYIRQTYRQTDRQTGQKRMPTD